MTFRRKVLALALSLFAAITLQLAVPAAHAQALYTADKGADIFVFGGYNYTKPDYGPDGQNNTGITLGGDYTRYFGWHLAGYPVDPSVELRIDYTKGKTVEERVGLVGLRLHTTAKERYHPYINFLGGIGVIDYYPASGFPRDHGTTYSLGGGIDIDLVHNFQLKLDFQEQSWNLGQNAVQVPQGGNYTLSPMAYTVGVSYHIPFSSNVGANAHNNKPDKAPKPGKTPAAKPATASATPTAPNTTIPPSTTPADTTTAPVPNTSTDPTTPPATTAPATTTPPATTPAPPAM